MVKEDGGSPVLFLMVSLDEEINPRFYRGKEKKLSHEAFRRKANT